jgi:hypothetical protein
MMSHHSRLAQHKAALTNGHAPHPSILRTTVSPAPPPGQITIDQLVPSMLAAGVQTGYAVQIDAVNKVVRVLVCIGPIQVPLDFGADGARDLSAGIMLAADTIDPPAAAPATLSAADAADLAASYAALGARHRDE